MASAQHDQLIFMMSLQLHFQKGVLCGNGVAWLNQAEQKSFWIFTSIHKLSGALYADSI